MSVTPPSPPQSDAGDTPPRPLAQQSRTPPSDRLADRFHTLARVSSDAIEEVRMEAKLRQRVKQEEKEESPSPPRRQRRSTNVRNCDGCRIRKAKCDRGRPCGNCTLRRVSCTYEEAGPDPFSGTRLHQNNADIARLRQHVFTLARRLGLSEQELDALTATADRLDEDEAARGLTVCPRSGQKRSLSEVFRASDDRSRSEGPPPKVQHVSPPRSSRAASPSRPSSSRSSPERRRASPVRATDAAEPAYSHSHASAFAAYPPEVVFSPYPPSSPYAYSPHPFSAAPYHVVHYVPYPAPPPPYSSSPSPFPPSSSTFPSHPPSAPHPSFPSHTRPPPATAPPPRIPGWSTTTSLAATTSAQRASPALLPPITIPTSLPSSLSRASASSSALPSAFSALRTTSTMLTAPSTAASPCPPGGGGFGTSGNALPPPPMGGYRLPPPKASRTVSGVGATLDGFASAPGAGGRRDGRETSAMEGRASCVETSMGGVSALLPPLRHVSNPEGGGAAVGLERHGRENGRVRLPSLSRAVSAEHEGRRS